MRHAVIPILLGLVALSIVACGSTPLYTHCSYEAKQAIKRQLQYPSSFDEHGMLTTSEMRERSSVYGNEADGWEIETAIIFGAENAFGVKSDFKVWYLANVNPDGKCIEIVLDDFLPYE